jgi:hypothetical protein
MSYTSFIQGLPVSGTSVPPTGTGYILRINTNINYSSIPSNVLNNIIGINISSGYTLTIDVNTTLPSNIVNIYGFGTLSINSGITLTIGTNTTFSVSTVSGSGTLSINSGITLTIGTNTTFSIATVSGAGTLSVSSGYTLTQGGAITISVSTVNVAGTWANAGYGITIPSGSTVTWNVTGSITTTSTPGTMTVNGTVYWYGNNIYLFIMAGTGIYLGAVGSTGTATNTISLSNTELAPDNGDGSATGTGKICYYTLTAISGSAVGKYYLQFYDSGLGHYPTMATIYIGTANFSYSISGSFNGNYTDGTGTVEVWNGAVSAGNITLTGTAYV